MRRWFDGGVYGAPSTEAGDAYIDEHYAKDGRAYGLGNQFVEGPAPFKAFRDAFVGAFSDLTFDMKHCFAKGDLVTLYWEASAVARATGQPLAFAGGGIVRMKNGQIVEAWNLVNFHDLLEQLGEVPEGAILTAFDKQAKHA
ncbi:MAG: ester cyclase [Myxococcales bacterium]|nr:ester cyclase [Myxococcales bacterium]